MADTPRTRCMVCGTGLAFDQWTRGQQRCDDCARLAALRGPAATFTRTEASAPKDRHAAFAREAHAYEQVLDDLPDDLIAEIAAALEAEARGDPLPGQTPLHDVMDEVRLGRSPREIQWTTWGFAAGFAANVALAKYAQMATSAPMSQFAAPLLVGGLVAGATCAALGWGIAKLRDRA